MLRFFVMAGLVPAIHAASVPLICSDFIISLAISHDQAFSWMAGTSPAMTKTERRTPIIPKLIEHYLAYFRIFGYDDELWSKPDPCPDRPPRPRAASKGALRGPLGLGFLGPRERMRREARNEKGAKSSKTNNPAKWLRFAGNDSNGLRPGSRNRSFRSAKHSFRFRCFWASPTPETQRPAPFCVSSPTRAALARTRPQKVAQRRRQAPGIVGARKLVRAFAPYSRPRLSPGPASASARPTSSPRSSIEVCSRTVRSSPFACRSACSGERATLTVTLDSTSGCR